MTNGGVDRSVECTGNINAMIQAFECVHDVRTLFTHSIERIPSFIQTEVLTTLLLIQGWGVAVLVGVPHKDAEFKTHPMNFLNERTLKGTFFGNYKPRTDLPNVVELYMKKVNAKSCFFSSLATLLVDPLLKLLAVSPPPHPKRGLLILRLRFVCAQELDVEKFITHSVPFAEINKAFDLMAKGEGIRCIIRMEN